MRIPVAGNLNGGFLNIVAKRDSVADIFSTETIELELDSEDDIFVIYDKNLKNENLQIKTVEDNCPNFLYRVWYYIIGSK